MNSRSDLLALITSALTFMAGHTQAQVTGNPQLQPVTDPAQVKAIELRLQVQLDRLGAAQIDHCGPVVRLVVSGTSGYDQTEGANCALAGARQSTLMCADTRGGQFALTLSPIPDLETVRRFLADNCYPKG